MVRAIHAGKRQDVEVLLPDWAAKLQVPARYKVLLGGRGSAKSWTAAALILLRAAQRPMRIACVREHQTSIQESSKQLLDQTIWRQGLQHFFKSYEYRIEGINGTRIFFHGMSTSTRQSIRGWEDIDLVWVEEAQRMTDKTADILYPTIRKPGSEIWLTWNPDQRTDRVYRDFVSRGGARAQEATILKVNFNDNPWFTPELELERQICLRDEPTMYAHIWLGEPDDAGRERHVLPFAMLQRCLEAWPMSQGHPRAVSRGPRRERYGRDGI